jgi:hypothetical protein
MALPQASEAKHLPTKSEIKMDNEKGARWKSATDLSPKKNNKERKDGAIPSPPHTHTHKNSGLINFLGWAKLELFSVVHRHDFEKSVFC